MTERIRTPVAADERTSLEAFLDNHRATVVLKVAGLPDELARRRLVASRSTVAGIVQHLATAERYWFRGRLLGDGWTYPGWDADEDADFDVAGTTTLAEVVMDYELACAESRAVAADLSLDALAAVRGEGGDYVSLRWILLHMVEETARHNGHLDVLRELLDGATGL
ncbi:MAG TPA: DinB family protein [Actinomycetes bacterium]